MKSGKLLAGILAGFAAGAVIGMLFAPEKGANTRRKIMKKGEGYADDLKERFEDFVDSLNEKYESAMQKKESILPDGQLKPEDIKSEKA